MLPSADSPRDAFSGRQCAAPRPPTPPGICDHSRMVDLSSSPSMFFFRCFFQWSCTTFCYTSQADFLVLSLTM